MEASEERVHLFLQIIVDYRGVSAGSSPGDQAECDGAGAEQDAGEKERNHSIHRVLHFVHLRAV